MARAGEEWNSRRTSSQGYRLHFPRRQVCSIFFFGDNEPPAAGGSRPERLSPVFWQQERDKRRTVVKIEESHLDVESPLLDEFLEALDGQQLSVVDGSEVLGSPGVSLPGDLARGFAN